MSAKACCRHASKRPACDLSACPPRPCSSLCPVPPPSSISCREPNSGSLESCPLAVGSLCGPVVKQQKPFSILVLYELKMWEEPASPAWTGAWTQEKGEKGKHCEPLGDPAPALLLYPVLSVDTSEKEDCPASSPQTVLDQRG